MYLDNITRASCDCTFQACRSCLKKVSGAVRTNSQLTSEETVNQLDNVVTICCAISPW